jgi:phophatidylinositol-4-phosphate 5-kinase
LHNNCGEFGGKTLSLPKITTMKTPLQRIGTTLIALLLTAQGVAQVTEFRDEDKPVNGIYTLYYLDKNGKNTAVFATGQYKNRKLNGAVKAFYRDGTLMFEEFYKDDKLEGVRKFYNEDGGLMNIKHYANGKMNGVYEEYYSNGQLQKTVTYKDDMPNG